MARTTTSMEVLEFVEWIDLLCWDGGVQRCSPNANRDLFNWTIGGMGLTGIVLRALFAYNLSKQAGCGKGLRGQKH